MHKEALERDKYAKEIGKVLTIQEKRELRHNGDVKSTEPTMASFWAPHNS